MKQGTSRPFGVCFLLAAAMLSACSPQAPQATSSIAESTENAEIPTSEPTQELPTTAEPTALSSGDVRVSEIDDMEQIYIAEGDFIMGADDDEAKDTACRVNGVACAENPVSTVYVPAFWMDKYEVTNYQYSLCTAAGFCQAPKLGRGTYTGNPIDDQFFDYYDNPKYANHPMVYVDFYMARDYCAWAGRRLPTEREWEKAARGTDGRKYPWGNDAIGDDRGNFCDGNCPKDHANNNYDDGYAQTAPVGSYPAGASAYGVMDMAGNVWEWVNTIPMDYPYNPEDGREEPDTRPGSCYPPDSCAADETPFGAGPERIWRGGTWANGPWWIRATVRYHSVPGYYHNSLGFRCAADE
ncbi:MAG TPA: formylglycine-generating enzyme family protein [Anaerolineales bacterium]|nr:formylglycine-generating enzyme family protein [Anaerolineales bacterium]